MIAYGAANFNPTGKGEKAVPTTFVSRRCAQWFPTTFVDEFLTTKVCCRCDALLWVVQRESKVVGGLRWCSNTNCRSFINRDNNAALNILRCYTAGAERPTSLSRHSGASGKKPQVFTLHTNGQSVSKADGAIDSGRCRPQAIQSV